MIIGILDIILVSVVISLQGKTCRTGNRTFKSVPGNRRVCIFPGNQPVRFIVT